MKYEECDYFAKGNPVCVMHYLHTITSFVKKKRLFSIFENFRQNI